MTNNKKNREKEHPKIYIEMENFVCFFNLWAGIALAHCMLDLHCG